MEDIKNKNSDHKDCVLTPHKLVIVRHFLNASVNLGLERVESINLEG